MVNVLPRRADFFNHHVQKLDIAKLHEDDTCCNICTEDYDTKVPQDVDGAQFEKLQNFDDLPFAQMKNIGLDEPFQLPCGHMFGSQCIQIWVQKEFNTCPMCRTPLFENSEDKKAPEDLLVEEYSRLDDIPIRELLTPTWTDGTKENRGQPMSIPFQASDWDDVVWSLPLLIFKVATRFVKIPKPASQLVFPSPSRHYARSPYYDVKNYTKFLPAYMPIFLEANKLPANPELEFILESPYMKLAYASVAQVLTQTLPEASKVTSLDDVLRGPGFSLRRYSEDFMTFPVVFKVALSYSIRYHLMQEKQENEEIYDLEADVEIFNKMTGRIVDPNVVERVVDAWLVAFLERRRRSDELLNRLDALGY
jgi:hypothetical protein